MKNGESRGSNLARAYQPLDFTPGASQLEGFRTKLPSLVVSGVRKMVWRGATILLTPRYRVGCRRELEVRATVDFF